METKFPGASSEDRSPTYLTGLTKTVAVAASPHCTIHTSYPNHEEELPGYKKAIQFLWLIQSRLPTWVPISVNYFGLGIYPLGTGSSPNLLCIDYHMLVRQWPLPPGQDSHSQTTKCRQELISIQVWHPGK